ncbi:MAG: hypothetical protein R3C56_19195 [Pirellulaceae bacterium]
MGQAVLQSCDLLAAVIAGMRHRAANRLEAVAQASQGAQDFGCVILSFDALHADTFHKRVLEAIPRRSLSAAVNVPISS